MIDCDVSTALENDFPINLHFNIAVNILICSFTPSLHKLKSYVTIYSTPFT